MLVLTGEVMVMDDLKRNIILIHFTGNTMIDCNVQHNW